MKRWEDTSNGEITAYALVMAGLISGGMLAQPILDTFRNGFSWWLLGYLLTTLALGALAFFASRQGGRYVRRHRRQDLER